LGRPAGRSYIFGYIDNILSGQTHSSATKMVMIMEWLGIVFCHRGE